MRKAQRVGHPQVLMFGSLTWIQEHRQKCLRHFVAGRLEAGATRESLTSNDAGLGFIGWGMNLLIPEKFEGGGDVVARILRGAKTIAVVGLSSKPMRASNGVAAYLKAAGYRIIPVNPNETEVLGEKAYARLEDVPDPVDIVDVFRKGEDVPPVADAAIGIGAKVLWLQLGIENAEAAEKARAAGLVVVENACLLVEHKRRRG